MALEKLKQKLHLRSSKVKHDHSSQARSQPSPQQQQLEGRHNAPADIISSSVSQAGLPSSPIPATDPTDNQSTPSHQPERSGNVTRPQGRTSEAAEASIHELWSVAYDHLREIDEGFIDNYEKELRGNLTAALGSMMLGSKADRQDQMRTILQTKMEEVNRESWRLKFGSSEVQVKELVQPILGVVDWANEYITGAVAANPCASLAWSGVSLLLPLFLNPSRQAASLATGLEYISTLIVKSRMWENLYTRRCELATGRAGQFRPSEVERLAFKDALEKLYQEILRFQIGSYCYYNSKTAVRVGLDMVKWNEWDTLLATIQERESIFSGVNSIWQDATLAQEWSAEEVRHQEATRQWQRIGTDVSSLTDAVRTALEEKTRGGLLDWLCTLDPSKAYNAARKKYQVGTSDWLIRDRKEFKTWETSASSLLWLHGKAGSGKSILSSSVVAYIKDRVQSDPQTALAYFFLSFSNHDEHNLDNVLASLVKQLYASRPDAPQAVENLVYFKEKGERPDTKTLEAALLATTSGFSATFIIIDALDECPQLDWQRMQLMDSLGRIIKALPDNVHILCTSRPEADIVTSMKTFLYAVSGKAIDLTECRNILDYDIGLYIDSEFASTTYSSWPVSLKHDAKRVLIDKADGMFQYVACQLESLRMISIENEVREELKHLPVGLDKTYDRMLSNVQDKVRTQVISLLKWLAASRRDLKLEELAEIFIFCPDKNESLDKANRLFEPADCIKHMSSLVVTQDSCVRLAHFTVQEYLMSDRISEKCFFFTEIDANLHIARTSLSYHMYVSSVLRKTVSWSKVRDFALTGYAVENWAVHLEMVPRERWPVDVVRLAALALATRSDSLNMRHKANDCLNMPSYKYGSPPWADAWLEWDDDQEVTRADVERPHFYTARQGFLKLTEMLLSGGPGINPYLTQQDLDRTLQNAASMGRHSIVELLIKTGADVSAQNGFSGGALQAAVGGEHTKVVELLLNHGADMDVQSGEIGSALQAAVRRNRLDFAQMFVRRGANVNTYSEEAGCPLMSALSAPSGGSVLGDATDCLRFLLERGANKNRQCIIRGTPLHYAATKVLSAGGGGRKRLQLLLEKGVDVNLSGGQYGYPLQALCQNAAVATSDIKLLLSKGANVNAEGGEYGNSLQALCQNQRMSPEKLQLLLDRGANINAEGGKHGSPLQALCQSFYVKISAIELLLSKGANINSGGGIYGNPLQALCQNTWADRGEVALALQLLLDRGANVNAEGGKHGSPLQALCQLDRVEISAIELLLSKGANVNSGGGEYGNPLQALCRNESVEKMALAFQLLLDRGANVNAEGGLYGSALQAVFANRTSSEELKKAMAEALVERGAQINAQGGFFGTSLQSAIATPWESQLPNVQFLLDSGADPNIQGGHYDNALQAACTTDRESTEIVQLLLDSKANVNAQGCKLGNPLQAACRHRNVAIARVLLDHGADVNAEGGEYGTALQAACSQSCLEAAALLIEHGANVHIQGGKFGSAWHAAAEHFDSGYSAVLKLLLDNGVDVDDARGRQHRTALQAALEFKSAEEDPRHSWHRNDRTRFLLEHNASVNTGGGIYGLPLQSACADPSDTEQTMILLEARPEIEVNVEGGLFGSALQAAAHSGHTDVVRMLLLKGANVNARGGKCGSALNAAVLKGYWDIVEVLLKEGATPDSQTMSEPDEEWLAGVRANFFDGQKLSWADEDRKAFDDEKRNARARDEACRGAVERYRMFWEKSKNL